VIEHYVAKIARKGKKAISFDIAFSHEFATLERLYVFSLPALGTLGHIELHCLTLLQASETAGLDSREMHKNVFATLTADEAVPFSVIEPLYCSLFCHVDSDVPLIDLRWRDSEVLRAGCWLMRRELLTTDSI
jgi:hypothetical protein